MQLDFDAELELANQLKHMADPATLREALRRLIRLKEMYLEPPHHWSPFVTANEFAAALYKRDAEYRELFNLPPIEDPNG